MTAGTPPFTEDELELLSDATRALEDKILQRRHRCDAGMTPQERDLLIRYAKLSQKLRDDSQNPG